MKREDVFEYIKNKYHAEPEYLWEKYPNYAVLRHSGNRKWYAIVMDIDKTKIDVKDTKDTGVEDIINVKLPPETVSNLHELPEFLPAYHMNKTHWISVRLEVVRPDELANLISKSFELTK